MTVSNSIIIGIFRSAFVSDKKRAIISACVTSAALLHLHRASSCVFLSGQCHDQLSILSVTVAESPSGMSSGWCLLGRGEGFEGGPCSRPSSVALECSRRH